MDRETYLKKKAERNMVMTIKVLNGMTISKAGKLYGISNTRVRQVVAKTSRCKFSFMGESLYGVSVKELRRLWRGGELLRSMDIKTIPAE